MDEMQRTRNMLISIVNKYLNGITEKDLYDRYKQQLNDSPPISHLIMVSIIRTQLSDAIKCDRLGRTVLYKPLDTKNSNNTSYVKYSHLHDFRATLSFPIAVVTECDSEPEPQETWTRSRFERELKIYSLEFPRSVAEILKPNTTEVVKVSEINAPSKFWIHLQKYDNELGKLQKKLRQFYHIQTDPMYIVREDLVKENDYYVLNINGAWFRCMVDGIEDSGLRMRLVDYGTLRSKISATDVRVLDPLFYKIPIFSVVCTLNDIRPLKNKRAFTLESAGYFMKLAKRRSLNAHIKRIESNGKTLQVSVELIDIKSNGCVNEEMVRAGHAIPVE